LVVPRTPGRARGRHAPLDAQLRYSETGLLVDVEDDVEAERERERGERELERQRLRREQSQAERRELLAERAELELAQRQQDANEFPDDLVPR
jgi:hypothetical protein